MFEIRTGFVPRSCSANLVVGFEIDDDRRISIVEYDIDHAFDQPAGRIQQADRNFAAAAIVLGGFVSSLKQRMREHSLHNFNGGFQFSQRTSKNAAVSACKTDDDVALRVERNGGEYGVDERAEAAAGGTARGARELDDFEFRQLLRFDGCSC